MRNYKILVIILLAISITVITSISHAQISEQIPSPKKQIDNGVAPHDVICRGLVLVDRGADKIACIKETSIQNTIGHPSHFDLIARYWIYSELIDGPKIKSFGVGVVSHRCQNYLVHIIYEIISAIHKYSEHWILIE